MNTRKISAVAVLVASLSLFACDEQVVPTEQSKDAAPQLQIPTDDRRAVSVIGDDPPPSAPPEYQQYTWIDVTADVGWLDAHTAYATAVNRYGANNATADINLSVRNAAGTVIGSNTGHLLVVDPHGGAAPLPAYSFTPSRCPAESRPLRVEPAPFLCAIAYASIFVMRTVVVLDRWPVRLRERVLFL